MLAGAVLGWLDPNLGAQMKPLGDGFISLVRMLIGPVIFCTVVHGVAGMNDMRRVGRVAIKALLYFEAVTTVALGLALLVVNLWRPGAGMNVDLASLDAGAVADYAARAQHQNISEFLLHVIPKTFVGAFAGGRRAAGAADLPAHRLRSGGPGRAGPADREPHREGRRGRLQDRRLRDVGRAAGGVRGHRLHGGQVRRGLAGLAGGPDRRVLCRVRPVHPAGAGAHRLAGRGEHLPPAWLHPRGAADRGGHDVVGDRAAAPDAEAAGAGLRGVGGGAGDPHRLFLQSGRHLPLSRRRWRCSWPRPPIPTWISASSSP